MGLSRVRSDVYMYYDAGALCTEEGDVYDGEWAAGLMEGAMRVVLADGTAQVRCGELLGSCEELWRREGRGGRVHDSQRTAPYSTVLPPLALHVLHRCIYR